MNLRTICLLALACMLAAPVRGQGYDTKFKAVGYKPGDVYQTDEGVSVSLNGGGLEVSLPLGPALPGPLPLRPTVQYHGKYSQSLNPRWYSGIYYDATGNDNPAQELTWCRWNPPVFPTASLSPGALTLNFAAQNWYADGYQGADLSLSSPSGKRTEYFRNAPGAKWYGSADQTEVRGTLTALVPEWTYASTWGTAATGDTGMRTSDGSILIFGPMDHQIVGKWDSSTDLDGTPRDVYIHVPTEIVQIEGNLITLWRQSRNYYKGDRNAQLVATQMWWAGSVYHPVWIKTRSGFKVNVDIYRGTPADFAMAPRNAAIPMVERGLLTGWKVSYTANGQEVGFTVDSTAATPITFENMAGTPSTSGLTLTGATPAQIRSTFGWQAGTTDGYDTLGMQRFYDAEYSSSELQMNIATATLTHGPLSTHLEFNGPAQGLLSKLVTPSGKTYTFTYQMTQGVGVGAPTNGLMGRWNYNGNTPAALDYWSAVTSMAIQDGVAAQTRTTSYQWAIPHVAASGGALTWPSRTQGVAQTLPDGETVLHVFASPVDLPAPGTTLDLPTQASTFMAMRESVVARYHYKAGDTSWQAFFSGGDPAATTWFKRERFEGWDFRGWETTLTAIMANTEPRATRSISEEKGGPVVVTESDAWNPAINQYGVTRTYTLTPGASPSSQAFAPGALQGVGSTTTYLSSPGISETVVSGATSQGVKATTFQAPAEGLFGRPAQVQASLRKAPASGVAGQVPTETSTYDTTPGRAHVLLTKSQVAVDGSGAHVDLAFTSAPQGLFGVDRLTEVKVTGSAPDQSATNSLSGQVGAKYAYDTTGRWMTTIQLRKDASSFWSYQAQEPSHDDMGRPLSQVDENSFATTFTWDELGRLTSLAPASPEVGTTIDPDDSLRLVTVDRGSQHAVYHLNGFGELIAEERTGSSYRLFGYDSAGHKTWETTWRSGTPDLTKWTGALPGAGTTFDYDTRGRQIRATSPNGEVVETHYDIGGNPLVSQQVVAPGTDKEATTTFTRDVLGRLADVATSPDGTISYDTAYAYDQAGRITKATQTDLSNGHSQIRTWTYDGLGRLITLVQPESGTTAYSAFTVTGKPTVTVYGSGSATPRTVTTSYDSLERPLTVTASDGSVNQAFTYDQAGHGAANGKLTNATADGVTRSLTYGGLNGRLSSIVRGAVGQTFTLGLAFDTYGNLASRTYPDGRVQAITYDAARSLPSGTSLNGTNLATMAYDATSWLMTGLTYGNNGSSVFGYTNERLTAMSHFIPGQTLASWAFQYDTAGNLTTDGEDWYAYDKLGRLTGAFIRDPQDGVSSHGLWQGFGYDAFGNRTSLSSQKVTNWATGSAPPASPALVGLGSDPRDLASYAMNGTEVAAMAATNRLPGTAGGVQTGAAYDPQGNLTSLWRKPGSSGSQLTMTYDAWGRVTSLADAARPGIVEKYQYDDEGLRMVVETWQGSTLQKREFNVYNEARQLVAQYEWVLQ